MVTALVHVLEHWLDHAFEGFVAMRATEAPVFLKIILSKAAVFAAQPCRGRLRVERRFQKQIRERKPVGVSDAFGLSALFAEVDLMYLVINDLRQMNRRRLRT